MSYYNELPKDISEDELRQIFNQPNMQVLRSLQLRYLRYVRGKGPSEILNMPIAKTSKGTTLTRQDLHRILNSSLLESIERYLDKLFS